MRRPAMVPGWASGSGELDLIELAELIGTEKLADLAKAAGGMGTRSRETCGRARRLYARQGRLDHPARGMGWRCRFALGGFAAGRQLPLVSIGSLQSG
jgi:hypothetical protein